jgi:hypothetical protein
MTETKPVELLRDRRGIYGLGVSDPYGLEAAMWACGCGPEDTRKIRDNLILRPDMFQPPGKHRPSAVLQKITSGFRHFRRSHEERLREVIHHEALIRAGLLWPPPREEVYWSRDKKQQDLNRRIYQALRRVSFHIINKLIGIVLQEAADPDALRVARRFAFDYRELIYRAGAKSRRAVQLAEAFPVLALAVYCPDTNCNPWSGDPWSEDRYYNPAVREAEVRQYRERLQEATDLVERGARLRKVAAVMRIPMALRRVKPGAAHLAAPCHDSEWVISHMPDSLPGMRVWLGAVLQAHHRAGSDFAEWTARHAFQIPCGSKNERRSFFFEDTADWVRASHGNVGTNSLCVRSSRPCRCGPSRDSAPNGTRPSHPTSPDLSISSPRRGSRQPQSTAWKSSRLTTAQTSIVKAALCTTASALMPTRCGAAVTAFIAFVEMGNA